MPDGLVLLLASAPCLGLGKLAKLLHCSLVPASQGFNWERDETNPLPLASLLSTRNEGVVLKIDPNIVTEDVLDKDDSFTKVNGKQEHKDASGFLYSLVFPNLYQCHFIHLLFLS